MAASYPAGYDVMSDPAANLSGPPLHSTMHNQINDVIEAMQVELGLNPSGADATVAATLAALSSRYAPLPSAGVLYGINHYNAALGANTAAPQTTAAAMITQAMPAAPAGSLLDLTMTIYVNSAVGHGSAFLSFRVNGVTVGPTIVVTDENALRTYSGRVVAVVPPTGSAYNVQVMAAKSNAGGSATLQAANSTLSIVSYRP